MRTSVKWKETSPQDVGFLFEYLFWILLIHINFIEHLQPFLIAELPSEEIAVQIANRSVTLKHVTELWVSSTELDELHNALKQYSKDFLLPNIALHSARFRFNVEIYCKAQTYAEKVARMEVCWNNICSRLFLRTPWRRLLMNFPLFLELQLFTFSGTSGPWKPRNNASIFRILRNRSEQHSRKTVSIFFRKIGKENDCACILTLIWEC